MKLPEGWTFRAGTPAKTCESCGHTEPEVYLILRDPDGHERPLFGCRGQKQIDEMVTAVIEAHPRGFFPRE